MMSEVQSIPTAEDNPLGMPSNMLAFMQETAHRYPRNPDESLMNALQELEDSPELASKAYYSIPYNQGEKNETRVEGLSINAAMVLARSWRNCLNGGRFNGEDDSNVFVEGIFYDMETNIPTMRPIKVSKFYKPRGSDGLKRRNADLLYNAVQAGVSKAIRNAILATLPTKIKNSYFDKAKALVLNPPKHHKDAGKSIGERIVEAKKVFFKEFKVSPKVLDEYLAEHADALEDEKSVLLHLKGLYNSFKDNPKMVEETFGEAEKIVESQPAK